MLLYERALGPRGAASLLNHMRQFMRDEFLTLEAFGLVLARAKNDVASNCVSQGAKLPRAAAGVIICVNSYATKVFAEPVFEKRSHALIKGLPAAPLTCPTLLSAAA